MGTGDGHRGHMGQVMGLEGTWGQLMGTAEERAGRSPIS